MNETRDEFLSALMDVLPDGVLVVDERDVILSFNKRFVELWGIPPGLAEGGVDEPLLRFVGEQNTEPEAFFARVKHLYAHKEETARDELRLKDGRTFDRFSSPVLGRDGLYLGRTWSFRDITGHTRAVTGLRASEVRYRRLFEAARDGILILDAGTGDIVDVNPFLIELLGMSRTQFLGKKVWEIGTFKDVYANKEKFLELQTVGFVRYDDLPLQTGDGRKIQVEFVSNVYLEDRYRVIQCNIRDNTARNHTLVELERFKTAIEQVGEGILITDPAGTVVFVNPAFTAMTGYGLEEALGKNPRFLRSGRQDAAFYREMWDTISSGRAWKGITVNRCKNGDLRTAETTITPMRDAGGRTVNYVAVSRDATQRLRLESDLRQSQKMESVGRLAGGVAHDFNNILTAINGYTAFALTGLAADDQRRADLEEVLAGSERAARLTGQLLAFSRKQIMVPVVLDLNLAVGGIVRMLKRLIGEDVRLVTKLSPQPCLAKLDPGQIEQVFLNLAVNARDSMPKGGTLTFETGIEAASEEFAALHPDMARGSLVVLTVRDTGQGMSDAVQTRLFEPFFTTKESGKGTGMGLSMVYGIVKQSGGDIEVESVPAQGSTFRIYLPRVEAPEAPLDPRVGKAPGTVRRGDETILLVDDEDAIRRLMKRVMAAAGYAVLDAANGQDALKVLAMHGKAVDLLVTDVVMPGMSGRDLSRAAAAKGLVDRTLFISGFTDEAIVQHGVLEPGLAFMYKPFAPHALLDKMREILDGPAERAKS